MTKYEVTAQSCDPNTGEPKGMCRSEIIDTKTNSLFTQCRTHTDVLEAYQAFWNRFPTYQSEMVLVHFITKVE